MAGERVGLLVVRARVEAASSQPLRAVVRLTSDVSKGFTEEVALADADALTAVVRDWLHRMLTDLD